MKKILAALFLTLVVLIGWSGISYAEVAGEAELEQKMLEMINEERSEVGLAPLKMDNKLVQLARLKSQDMIEKNYFSHTSPTYGDPFQMMKDFGVEYWMAGENLAGNPSLTGAHESLMNSPGHRANILKPEFTHVGIGIVKGGRYGMMFTQMFIKARDGERVETSNTPIPAPVNPVEQNKETKEPREEKNNLSIFYSGKQIVFPDITPFINTNQRVMVPLRFVSQEMGYNVDWNEKEQKIIIKKDQTEMNLWIGKNLVLKDNRFFAGDSSPIIHNNRTMVPLRMVSELLGCEVIWYPTLNKVEIN
ncbi:MAG: hypothetical protein GXW85_01280 [Clostridia bacterium]|nr:hypothetical protein [Clostridia bacterium]